MGGRILFWDVKSRGMTGVTKSLGTLFCYQTLNLCISQIADIESR